MAPPKNVKNFAKFVARVVFLILRLSPMSSRFQSYSAWIHHVLNVTRISIPVSLLGLRYLDRLMTLAPTVALGALHQSSNGLGHMGIEYQLTTACLSLANDFLDDNAYANKAWSEATGFNVRHIIAMKVKVLNTLNHRLGLAQDEYPAWLNLMQVLAVELDQQTASQIAVPPTIVIDEINDIKDTLSSDPRSHSISTTIGGAPVYKSNDFTGKVHSKQVAVAAAASSHTEPYYKEHACQQSVENNQHFYGLSSTVQLDELSSANKQGHARAGLLIS
jgi:hypothetical protein